MRAVAVGAVLAYHLWPGAVTGGYVGVDVFLVISGFLITSHLLREQPTTWRAVGRFWGRRVRRLLPASALVVLTTVGIAALVLPSTQLVRTGRDALASALYVQNWALAASATDYLSADEAPTALRHYWSLAVEEQYYLVWPVLIGLTVLLARRIGRGLDEGLTTRVTRISIGVVVGSIVLGSLAWSVHLTAVDPAAAYYVTSTRVWELALGGATALALSTGRRVTTRWAAPLAGAGLVAVVVAIVTFDALTPFPGAAALLPTLGTAAVIAAAAPPTAWTTRLLGARLAQLLGNVSYSTYLWHWPLIVLAPFALRRDLAGWDLLLVAAVSVALAWMTTRWFEDPIRRSRRLAGSPWLTVGILVACTAGGASAATVLMHAGGRADQAASTAAAAHPDCLGASASLSGVDCTMADGQLWTTPVQAQNDKPVLYADDCWNDPPFGTRTTCTYGDPDATVRVALVGNSHAGHWFAPIAQVAADRGWQITTYVASSCYPVDVDLSYPDPQATAGCTDWNQWVRDQVAAQSYDLVVMSARTDQHLDGAPEDTELDLAMAAYARELTAITETGAGVLVIRDTPNFPESVPDCVAASPDQDCTVPRAQGLERDPLAQAAQADTSGQVELLDVTDLLCDDETCHGVVGAAIVMFDHGHLTSTFAGTLRPVVEPALDAALADRR
jgi:peptidoglycan/LPS O-acetylase OafA/YrhL